MIIDRLPVRLYWFHLRGIACKHDKRLNLTQPPHLPGLEIEGIDYAPNVVAMVMPRFYGWRDMQPHEIQQAIKLLDELVENVSVERPACP